MTARTDIIQGFAALGVSVDRHAFRFRTDNQIVFWEAIRAGNGIGFAQRALAERDPLVETILPELALPSLPMWLAMHRDVRTSARVRRVADFLFAELKRYAGGLSRREIGGARQAAIRNTTTCSADSAMKIGPKPVRSATKPIADGAINMPE